MAPRWGCWRGPTARRLYRFGYYQSVLEPGLTHVAHNNNTLHINRPRRWLILTRMWWLICSWLMALWNYELRLNAPARTFYSKIGVRASHSIRIMTMSWRRVNGPTSYEPDCFIPTPLSCAQPLLNSICVFDVVKYWSATVNSRLISLNSTGWCWCVSELNGRCWMNKNGLGQYEYWPNRTIIEGR